MRVDCIVMAGGKATRMGGVVKPLLDVCGVPMIVRVVRSISGACRGTYVVYSKWTKALEDLCSGVLESVVCVEGGGEGYVEDLKMALNLVSLPTLVVPADIPFLNSAILEDFIVKAMLKPEPIVNLSTEKGLTGISLFKQTEGPWADVIIKRSTPLIDVDTWDDYREAIEKC
ncbi:MAG: NTP transferase domain-containing protein [Thermoprotei archaeon]|nr:NTP transferase domain-containing protein [Thermoprotei archaeon]